MSTVTSADGTVIDYDRYGTGPAVIFIGGATQHRAVDENTTAAARLLADEGYTAVDYDRRGRDRSGDTAPWHLDREVEDLAALIDAVGGPVTLYTSSSGATVALAAVSAGLDIATLALYEPPFFAGRGIEDDLATIRALLAEGDLDGAMRHNLSKVIGIPADVVAGMSQSPVWPRFVAVARTLPYDLGAAHDICVDPDWKARWSGVRIPVVVLSGDQTFPGLTKCADDVAAALPNATRQILAGQSHGPTPEAMTTALRPILRTVAQTTTD